MASYRVASACASASSPLPTTSTAYAICSNPFRMKLATFSSSSTTSTRIVASLPSNPSRRVRVRVRRNRPSGLTLTLTLPLTRPSDAPHFATASVPERPSVIRSQRFRSTGPRDWTAPLGHWISIRSTRGSRPSPNVRRRSLAER